MLAIIGGIVVVYWGFTLGMGAILSVLSVTGRKIDR